MQFGKVDTVSLEGKLRNQNLFTKHMLKVSKIFEDWQYEKCVLHWDVSL